MCRDMVLPKRKEIVVDDATLTEETGNDDKQKDKTKPDLEKDDEGGTDTSLLPHKKHKKHKHKKHKRKRGSEQDAEDGSGSPTASEGGKPPLKLKIKFGGRTFGEKSVTKIEIPDASSEDSQGIVVDEGNATSAMNVASGDVDDEEAWLEALESGRLDDVDDELKVMKDPALMTARQRALLESKNNKDKEEVPLPPAATQEKEVSEEMIQRRMLRAKKRREQAEEKREKDKKQTIERLLKKNDVKTKGSKPRQAKKTNAPKMTYINNQETIMLLLPPGEEYPLSSQVSKPPPKPSLCGVEGCTKFKRYSCSKTGIPLCSLECYKKNLQKLTKKHS